MLSTSSAPSPLVILFACGLAAIVLALVFEAIAGTAIDLNAVLGVVFLVLLAVTVGVVAIGGRES